jgi:MoaA/NifB/PqqE/SkfB family radical SAM enzyme
MHRLPVLPKAPAPPPPKVALVSLTTACNAHCAFCCVLDILNRPELDPSDAQLLATLEETRAQGCTTLSFTGGEPTVHPRFAEFCRRGKALGFEAITINTNGIQFKRRAWTEEVLAAGLSSVDVSVHGHTAELHDALVERPGAFEALSRGMRHLRELAPRYGTTLGATTVVTALNAKHLGAIAETLVAMGFQALRFKHCFEGAEGADKDLVGLYQDALEPLRAALAYAHTHRIGAQTTHFPLCLLGPEAVFAADLADERVLSIDHKHEVLVQGRASLHRREPSGPCGRCLLASQCTQLDARYLPRHGDGFLKPVDTPEALHAFFLAGVERYRLVPQHPVWKVYDALLSAQGAPPLPAPGGVVGGRVLCVHLPGECSLRCAVCDCRAPTTPTDPEGFPEGLTGGGAELFLRGGAALSPWLPRVVARARQEGWARVLVRAPGRLFLGEAEARGLRDAGVDEGVLPLFAHRAAVHDALAGYEGALVDTLRALRALAGAGLAVSIEVPMLPPRLQDLPETLRLAHRAVPSLRAARLTRVTVPALGEAPWEALEAGYERARAVGQALGFEVLLGGQNAP